MRAHAAEHLPEDACVRSSVVDAVVAVGEVSLELARELARFEPCGYGNPGVNLLVPGAQLMGLQGMGEGGKHLRLQVADASAHCGAVAWGRGGDVRDAARRRRVTTSSAGSRSTTGAARSRRGSCCATSSRGPSASRSSSRPRRGSAPPGPPACAGRAGAGGAGRARRSRRGRAGRARRRRAAGRRARRRCRAAARDAARSAPLRRRRRCSICSRRGDPAVLEQALESFGDGVVAVADHHSFARLRGAARARRARARARPAGAPGGARGAGRGRAAACRSPRPSREAVVRPRVRRGRRAARRDGRALARGRAGCARRRSRSCARAPPGRTSRRPPTSSTRRSPRSPRAACVELSDGGLRQLAVAGKSDLAASPAYALHEGRRTRALAWLDALLAGRPAHPAAAA